MSWIRSTGTILRRPPALSPGFGKDRYSRLTSAVRGSIGAWAVAMAALIAAVLLRWLLDPLMGDTYPLVTLFGAVAAGVWLGGYRVGLTVGVLGYLACTFLFVPPRGTFDW